MEITIKVYNIDWDTDHIELTSNKHPKFYENLPDTLQIDYEYGDWYNKSIEEKCIMIESDIFMQYSIYVNDFDFDEDIEGYRNKIINKILK